MSRLKTQGSEFIVERKSRGAGLRAAFTKLGAWTINTLDGYQQAMVK